MTEELVAPHRPTVMILVGSYLPGFRGGGPVRGLANLIEALGSELQFMVLTADRDLASDQPYPGIRPRAFQSLGKGRVRYLAPGEGTRTLRLILRSTSHDVLYLTSFFSPRFTILPLALRRLGAIPRRLLVVSPRGEFSPGALGLKGIKKRMWLAVSRLLGLYRDATWHATTDDEARLIRSVIGGSARVVVAHELVSVVPVKQTRVESAPRVKQPGSARIVFLSRITRKKNLGFAVSLVSSVERATVTFDVYGPIEDEAYWQECQQRMMGAGNENLLVRYRGELPHADVPSVLSQYDLFLFPTLGENFGYAVAEALAAGCPVAISDRTPWQVEEAGAGWAIPLDDRRRWEAVIQEVVDSDEDALTPRRLAARRLARASASGEEDVEHYRHLFRAHAGG